MIGTQAPAPSPAYTRGACRRPIGSSCQRALSTFTSLRVRQNGHDDLAGRVLFDALDLFQLLADERDAAAQAHPDDSAMFGDGRSTSRLSSTLGSSWLRCSWSVRMAKGDVCVADVISATAVTRSAGPRAARRAATSPSRLRRRGEKSRRRRQPRRGAAHALSSCRRRARDARRATRRARRPGAARA